MTTLSKDTRQMIERQTKLFYSLQLKIQKTCWLVDSLHSSFKNRHNIQQSPSLGQNLLKDSNTFTFFIQNTLVLIPANISHISPVKQVVYQIKPTRSNTSDRTQEDVHHTKGKNINSTFRKTITKAVMDYATYIWKIQLSGTMTLQTTNLKIPCKHRPKRYYNS